MIQILNSKNLQHLLQDDYRNVEKNNNHQAVAKEAAELHAFPYRTAGASASCLGRWPSGRHVS